MSRKQTLTNTVSQDAITAVTDDAPALNVAVAETEAQENYTAAVERIGAVVNAACVQKEEGDRKAGSAVQRMALGLFGFHKALRVADPASLPTLEQMHAKLAPFQTLAITTFLGDRPKAGTNPKDATGKQINLREQYDNRAQLIRRGAELMCALVSVGVGAKDYANHGPNKGFFVLPSDKFLPRGYKADQLTPDTLPLDAKWFRAYLNEEVVKFRASMDHVVWAAKTIADEKADNKKAEKRAPRQTINAPSLTTTTTTDDGETVREAIAPAAVTLSDAPMVAPATAAQVQSVIAAAKNLPVLDNLRLARDVLRDYVADLSKQDTVGANADLLNLCADIAQFTAELRTLVKSKPALAA